MARWTSQVRQSEEDLSAKQTEAEEESRLQSTHEFACGQGYSEAETSQRPQAALCVAVVDRSRGRLTRSEDFARAYRAGRSVANKYLVLYYFDRSDPELVVVGEGPRVGFSVSKRLGGAVERNRVKRTLREAFRLCSQYLQGDLDLVFVARAPVVDLIESGGVDTVKEKMVEVLRKASVAMPVEGRRASR
jgi:ribonuclease P protein component